MDRDSDGFVSHSDYIFSILSFLKQLNISSCPKVEENLKSYFDIYYSSIKSLLNKYGLTDVTLCKIILINTS